MGRQHHSTPLTVQTPPKCQMPGSHSEEFSPTVPGPTPSGTRPSSECLMELREPVEACSLFASCNTQLPSWQAFPQVISTDEELERLGGHGHEPAGSVASPHKSSLPPRVHCLEPPPGTTPQHFQRTQESGMGVLSSPNLTLAFP